MWQIFMVGSNGGHVFCMMWKIQMRSNSWKGSVEG